jgi:nitrogen regulatory protein P-II 2
MKLIIAVIQPNKLEEVKAELTKNEIIRLTVSDVQGYGQQKGKTTVYRGHEYKVNLLPKVRLEIAVNDEFVKATVDSLLKAAKTGEGQIGDGKIFILPIEDVIRIRTGERGSGAI